MAYEIFGSFENKEDAIREVDKLSLSGIPSNKITMFTSKESAEEMKKETDGNVENVEENYDDGIKSKAKKAAYKITDKAHTSLYDELLEYGLTEEQAKKYANEIHSGKILVVANNELKMGHRSKVGEEELEVPYIDRQNY